MKTTVLPVVAMSLMLALGPAGRVRAAGEVIKEGADAGTINFTVWFEFPPTEAVLDLVQTEFQRASDIICDVTEGQMRFGTVHLRGGVGQSDVGKSAASVWVKPEGGRAHAALGGIEEDGPHIVLYAGEGDFTAITIAHEFGHLALSLGDEYEEDGRQGPCITEQEAGSALTSNVCLMQGKVFVDYLLFHSFPDPSRIELCGEMDHDLVRSNDPSMGTPDCSAGPTLEGPGGNTCERPDPQPDLSALCSDGFGNDESESCCSERCCLYNTETCRYEGTVHSLVTYVETGGEVLSCWSALAITHSEFIEEPNGLPEDGPHDCGEVTFDPSGLEPVDKVVLLVDRSYSMAFDPNAGQLCGDDCPVLCSGLHGQPMGSDPEDCHSSRIAYARDAGLALLQFLKFSPGAEAGLAAFSTQAAEILPIEGFGALCSNGGYCSTLEDFREALGSIQPNGDTNIGAGLLLAGEQLAEGGGSKAVFLLSDGNQSVAESDGGIDPLSAIEELAEDDIAVFSITMGEASNTGLFGQMAEQTSGATLDLTDSRELAAGMAQLYAKYSGTGLLIPKLRYEISAQSAVDEPPGSWRTPESWVQGGEFVLPDVWRSNGFRFHVEEGTTRLQILIAGAQERIPEYGVRAVLQAPGGAIYDTENGEVPGIFLPILWDGFLFLRLDHPPVGDWRLQILMPDDLGGVNFEQTGTLTVLTSNPEVELLTHLDRRNVLDPERPVILEIRPIYSTELRDLDLLEAVLVRPDGQMSSLVIHDQTAAEGGYVARISDLALQGQYEVRIRMRTGPQTTNHPGETLWSQAPPSSVDVPVFERTATASFYVAVGEKVCLLASDCDGDGTRNGTDSMTADKDGDGSPDGCDIDADGDGIPDAHEFPRDSDRDGLPDRCDDDSDNDGLPDSSDPNIGGDAVHVVQLPSFEATLCGSTARGIAMLASSEPVRDMDVSLLYRQPERMEIVEVLPGPDLDPDDLRCADGNRSRRRHDRGAHPHSGRPRDPGDACERPARYPLPCHRGQRRGDDDSLFARPAAQLSRRLGRRPAQPLLAERLGRRSESAKGHEPACLPLRCCRRATG